MTKTRCESCDRNFKSEEALELHNRDKHRIGIKPDPKPSNSKKRNWTIFIVVIGAIVLLVGWAFSTAVNSSNECKTAPAETLNIGGHTNLAMHIHPRIQIIIDGQQQQIPANIGVGHELMRPIHTHDSSGEIHVEGPCKRDFVVGDFFKIWGKEFSNECIFDNCIDSGTLTMSVNGQQNTEFENLVLKDKDNIVINYNSN